MSVATSPRPASEREETHLSINDSHEEVPPAPFPETVVVPDVPPPVDGAMADEAVHRRSSVHAPPPPLSSFEAIPETQSSSASISTFSPLPGAHSSPGRSISSRGEASGNGSFAQNSSITTTGQGQGSGTTTNVGNITGSHGSWCTANIFIANLPPGWDTDALRQYYARFGEVLSVRVVTERRFGFVRFRTVEQAQLAILESDKKRPAPHINTLLHVSMAVHDEGEGGTPTNRLFVRGLPDWTTDAILRDAFLAIATPTRCSILLGPQRRCKGAGFVEFATVAEATKAVEGTIKIVGWAGNIEVKYSEPPESRTERQQRNKERAEIQAAAARRQSHSLTDSARQNPAVTERAGSHGPGSLLGGVAGSPQQPSAMPPNALFNTSPGLNMNIGASMVPQRGFGMPLPVAEGAGLAGPPPYQGTASAASGSPTPASDRANLPAPPPTIGVSTPSWSSTAPVAPMAIAASSASTSSTFAGSGPNTTALLPTGAHTGLLFPPDQQAAAMLGHQALPLGAMPPRPFVFNTGALSTAAAMHQAQMQAAFQANAMMASHLAALPRNAMMPHPPALPTPGAIVMLQDGRYASPQIVMSHTGPMTVYIPLS